MTETHYQSTVAQLGNTVDQIIHFAQGNKRTIKNILTSTIQQGEFTKFKTTDGRMYMINTANVDMVEVFSIEKK